MNAIPFDMPAPIDWRHGLKVACEVAGPALSAASFAAGLWLVLAVPGLLG